MDCWLNSLLYIFVYLGIKYVGMSPIDETNECDIRTPDIYKFPQVDGLSTGPPRMGCNNLLQNSCSSIFNCLMLDS